jgi:hypothetical protein
VTNAPQVYANRQVGPRQFDSQQQTPGPCLPASSRVFRPCSCQASYGPARATRCAGDLQCPNRGPSTHIFMILIYDECQYRLSSEVRMLRAADKLTEHAAAPEFIVVDGMFRSDVDRVGVRNVVEALQALHDMAYRAP